MILPYIFLSIASICYAIITFHRFHYGIFADKSRPYSFWGAQGYQRKYARVGIPGNGGEYLKKQAPKNWYYRIFAIPYREKFPGSATIFVPFTDGYHLVQWVMIKCLMLACTVYWGRTITFDWPNFLGLWAAWLLYFNFVYARLRSGDLQRWLKKAKRNGDQAHG